VNATLLFVAPDTLEKRRQFGLQAEQTFSAVLFGESRRND